MYIGRDIDAGWASSTQLLLLSFSSSILSTPFSLLMMTMKNIYLYAFDKLLSNIWIFTRYIRYRRSKQDWMEFIFHVCCRLVEETRALMNLFGILWCVCILALRESERVEAEWGKRPNFDFRLSFIKCLTGWKFLWNWKNAGPLQQISLRGQEFVCASFAELWEEVDEPDVERMLDFSKNSKNAEMCKAR